MNQRPAARMVPNVMGLMLNVRSVLKESHCHADNCKIKYLAWRVENTRKSFMEVGHTRCLVDGHFGENVPSPRL